MEVKYLEDGLLRYAKVFKTNDHAESILYNQENDLLKIFYEPFITAKREKTIIMLGEYENKECCIPKYLIHNHRAEPSFEGYGMKHYKGYECLYNKLRSLSFKNRMIIAKKIALLIESFEDEKIAYTDLHTGNIIIKNNNIVLVDFDSANLESIIGEDIYKILLGESYQNLCSLLLSIIYSIDIPGKPFECIISSNRSVFDKTANKNQTMLLEGSYTDNGINYHPSDYIDSFTEEYVMDTKKMLIL